MKTTGDATGANPYVSPATEQSLPTALFRRDGDGASLEFNVEKSDLIKLGRGHVKCHPGWRRTYLHYWFRSTLIFTLVGILMWWFSIIPAAATMFGLAAVFGIGYPFFYRRRVAQGLKNIDRLGRNLGMLGGRRMYANARGLYTHTEAGEFFYYWPAIELIVEFEQNIHIYVSANSAIIVPDRAFDSDEQRREYLGLIQSFQNGAVSVVAEAVEGS